MGAAAGAPDTAASAVRLAPCGHTRKTSRSTRFDDRTQQGTRKSGGSKITARALVWRFGEAESVRGEGTGADGGGRLLGCHLGRGSGNGGVCLELSLRWQLCGP